MPETLLIDDLIGAAAGSVGPRLDALESATAYASLLRGSWSDLLALSAAEGQGAEVAGQDGGSHGQATATGYDGATVPNAGRYSWSAAWSRWVRVGGVAGGDRMTLTTGFAFPAARGNLFRHADATLDSALSEGSGLVAFDDYGVSAQIPVPAGGQVTLARAEPTLNSVFGLEFCDRQGARVAFVGGPFTAWQVLSVPEAAATLRFTFRMTPGAPEVERDTVALYAGNVAAAQPATVARTPAFRDEVVRTREAVSAAVSRIGANVWTTAGSLADTAYNAETNTLVSFGTYVTSALLPVQGGVPLAIPVGRDDHTDPYGIGWFDAAGAHVGHASVNAINGDWSRLTPPPEAAFLRLSMTAAQKDGFVIRVGERFGVAGCPWEGRHAMILGDSIAVPGWFGRMCRTALGMTETRVARAGRRMAEALLAEDDTTPLTAADFADVDLVWLALGINDAIEATPLGTLADAAGAASFYGRTKQVVEQVLGWNPALRLVIQTLLPTGAAHPDATAYDAALRAVAAHYGQPLADLRGESGIGPHNIDAVTGDGLHPDAIGYARHIEPAARARLLGLLPAEV